MKDSKAPIIGTSLAILSAFLHSLDGLIVNRLSPMTAVEMAFWRCTGQCIWIWPVCFYRYVKNEKHSDLFYKPSYVFTYALITVACVLTGFYSLTLLPMGDAVAIFTSSIVWTCLLGFFYLKEHTHIVDFCMIPVTLCGVLFIAKPPFIFGGSDYTHRHLLGFGSAFACAVLIGLMYLVLRKVGSDIHYTVMSFYYSLVGLISLGFIVLITSGFSTPCQDQLIFIILTGVNGLLVMSIIQIALQYEKAGRVGILRNSQMIFAYILQLIFTDAQLNLHSVIGASLILIASLVIGLRKICK